MRAAGSFCGCPICDSGNRKFYCSACVNSLDVSVQGQQQQLQQCLTQAEQLREQKADLLKRLEQQLADRVGASECSVCSLEGACWGACARASRLTLTAMLSMHATFLQESAQLQQVAAWRKVQELKAANAKAQKAKAALAQGTHAEPMWDLLCTVLCCITSLLSSHAHISDISSDSVLESVTPLTRSNRMCP
jgi:hypothetical protein